MDNYNFAAFPIPLDDRPGAYPAEPGMSMRDYFAAALPDEVDAEAGDYTDTVKAALLGRPCPSLMENPLAVLEFEAEFRARWRYIRADAMLAARAMVKASES